MRIYGYARVSTPTQNIERQIRNIKEICPQAEIVTEAYTGTTLDRPEWNNLVTKLKSGDMVVFDSVSRMSRDADEGVAVYKKLLTQNIDLVFIKEPHINTEVYRGAVKNYIKTTGDEITDILIKAINELLLVMADQQIKLAFEQAEKEVADLRQRTREGIETARLSGKQIGRAKGQVVETTKGKRIQAEILKKSKDFGGKFNDKELIQLLGCSYNTFYKYKRMCRE